MSEKITFRDIWHAAGISGVVLAAISSAYFVFSQWASGVQAGWASALGIVADLAKIVACIYLMKLYLTRFHKANPQAQRSDLKRLGTMIALLSALVFSAITMAYYIWNPEVVEEVFATISTTMGSMLDANSRSVIDWYQENFAKISFLSNFIYCFLFGWILTLILVPRIISSNPFDEDSALQGNGNSQEDKEDSLFE